MRNIVQWFDIKQFPAPSGKLLICRDVNGNKYIDICAYFIEEPCGLKSYPTMNYVTHWAYLPQLPEE
jgi:hypothetical protein